MRGAPQEEEKKGEKREKSRSTGQAGGDSLAQSQEPVSRTQISLTRGLR
jgi:hypothetical protein